MTCSKTQKICHSVKNWQASRSSSNTRYPMDLKKSVIELLNSISIEDISKRVDIDVPRLKAWKSQVTKAYPHLLKQEEVFVPFNLSDDDTELNRHTPIKVPDETQEHQAGYPHSLSLSLNIKHQSGFDLSINGIPSTEILIQISSGLMNIYD